MIIEIGFLSFFLLSEYKEIIPDSDFSNSKIEDPKNDTNQLLKGNIVKSTMGSWS